MVSEVISDMENTAYSQSTSSLPRFKRERTDKITREADTLDGLKRLYNIALIKVRPPLNDAGRVRARGNNSRG